MPDEGAADVEKDPTARLLNWQSIGLSSLLAPAAVFLFARGYIAGRSKILGFPSELVPVDQADLRPALALLLTSAFFAVSLGRVFLLPILERSTRRAMIERTAGGGLILAALVALALDSTEFTVPASLALMGFGWWLDAKDIALAEAAGDEERLSRRELFSNPSGWRWNSALVRVMGVLGMLLLSSGIGARTGMGAAKAQRVFWTSGEAPNLKVVVAFLSKTFVVADHDPDTSTLGPGYQILPLEKAKLTRRNIGPLIANEPGSAAGDTTTPAK